MKSKILKSALAVSALCLSFASFAEASDTAEVAGEYSGYGMTLMLNDDGSFSLNGVEGEFTYKSNVSPFGEYSTTVTIDDSSIEALADVLPWYWNGPFNLGMDGDALDGTFSVSVDLEDLVINKSNEDGDGGYTVTTVPDSSSPTGNLSTITVPNNDYDNVYALGRWLGTKKELTDPDDPTSYPTEGVEPEEWENGMYYLEDQSLHEMTYNEDDDTWTLTLPLASAYMGIQCYYNVVETGDITGNFDHFEDYNKNCIPYDAEKQSDSYDWSVMFPRGSEEGILDTSVVVPTEDGNEINICVYTPYGYNADDSDTKYPVFYMFPGGGDSEAYMNWFKGGVVNSLFDNLIAEGKVSPTILISYRYDDAMDYFEDVMNYVEANYNTYTDQAHRAIAGFSMGGVGSCAIMLENPTLFQYCGLFSGSDPLFKSEPGNFDDFYSFVDEMSEDYWNEILDDLKSMDLLLGGGCTDINMFTGDENSASMEQASQWLDYYDIEHELDILAGGHDQSSWTPLTEKFAIEYLGSWGE